MKPNKLKHEKPKHAEKAKAKSKQKRTKSVEPAVPLETGDDEVYPGSVRKRMGDGRCVITFGQGQGRGQLCSLQDFAFGSRTEELAEIFIGDFREGESKETVADIKKQLIAGEAIEANGVNMQLAHD